MHPPNVVLQTSLFFAAPLSTKCTVVAKVVAVFLRMLHPVFIYVIVVLRLLVVRLHRNRRGTLGPRLRQDVVRTCSSCSLRRCQVIWFFLSVKSGTPRSGLQSRGTVEHRTGAEDMTFKAAPLPKSCIAVATHWHTVHTVRSKHGGLPKMRIFGPGRNETYAVLPSAVCSHDALVGKVQPAVWTWHALTSDRRECRALKGSSLLEACQHFVLPRDFGRKSRDGLL